MTATSSTYCFPYFSQASNGINSSHWSGKYSRTLHHLTTKPPFYFTIALFEHPLGDGSKPFFQFFDGQLTVVPMHYCLITSWSGIGDDPIRISTLPPIALAILRPFSGLWTDLGAWGSLSQRITDRFIGKGRQFRC